MSLSHGAIDEQAPVSDLRLRGVAWNDSCTARERRRTHVEPSEEREPMTLILARMSAVILQAESAPDDRSVLTDWYPGALLVLVIFGTWLFWRYAKKAGGGRKRP
jgi:hypothetical protein